MALCSCIFLSVGQSHLSFGLLGLVLQVQGKNFGNLLVMYCVEQLEI